VVGFAPLTTPHDYRLMTHPGAYFLGGRGPVLGIFIFDTPSIEN
jgi:hypothetical protein